MPTIGQFKKTNDDFAGHTATLTIDCDVSLIRNKDKKHQNSPDFFVKSGRWDVGLAYIQTHIELMASAILRSS